MKITRTSVLELNNVLKSTQWIMPIKSAFRYAISYNVKSTDKEIEAINEAFPAPEGYQSFLDGERAITAKYKITEQKQFDALADEVKEVIEAELKAYREVNKDFIDELNAIEKEKSEFLKEEVEIDLRTVKLDLMADIDDGQKYPHWEIWRVLETIIVE